MGGARKKMGSGSPGKILKLTLVLGAAAGFGFLDSAGGCSTTGADLSGTKNTKKPTEFNGNESNGLHVCIRVMF